MTAAAAYLVGRRKQALTPPGSAKDALFAADRIDSSELRNLAFDHCTFANISFKDCKFTNVKFRDCVFVSCYFRDTRIENCQFAGSKFIDCDLSKVDIRTSDFKFYNTFTDCYIRYRELAQSLPHEGNLRAHLCSNLAVEARKAGALRDEGLYRQAGAEGLEQFLISAFRHSDKFFREKYTGFARVSALGEYIISRARGLFWGYKHSSLVVLRNWAIATLGIFPLLFLTVRDGIQRAGKPATVGDVWLASVGNILPGSGISDVRFVSSTSLIYAFIEVLVGLLFTGIVAALIFRAVSDRWR